MGISMAIKINMAVMPMAISWWNSLSLLEKQRYISHFNEVRIWNLSRKVNQFPNMYDLSNLRISKFSVKHITRIWVFKDFEING